MIRASEAEALASVALATDTAGEVEELLASRRARLLPPELLASPIWEADSAR